MTLLGVTCVYAGLLIAAAGLLSIVRPLRFLRMRSRRVAGVGLVCGLLLVALGFSLPVHETRIGQPRTRLDDFVPVFQFSEHHSLHVGASPQQVSEAIRSVRADDISLFRTLTWIRRFGRPGPESILNAPERMPILDVATRTSFMLLADEPEREIVVGTLVLAPPGFRLRAKPTPEDFKRLAEPGFAKAAMNFLVEPDGHGGSNLSTETRVFATDPEAARRFARYWRVIYPGSALIRRMWLRAIRARAEAPTGASHASGAEAFSWAFVLTLAAAGMCPLMARQRPSRGRRSRTPGPTTRGPERAAAVPSPRRGKGRVGRPVKKADERLRRAVADEQRSRELAERLQASARAVSQSLDLDVVLPAILDELGRVIDYDSGTIQLIEGDSMRVIAVRGFPAAEVGRVRRLADYPYNQSLATRAEPIIVEDTPMALWRIEPNTAGIRSNVGVPLLVRDRIIGALTIDSHKPGRYRTEDARTVMAFARQAAIAIENARLFGAERAAREEAERLRAATQALSVTMDLREVLALILRELRRAVPYDSATVQELRGGRLMVVGGDGFPNLERIVDHSFDVDADPNGQVMRSRAPFIVADAPAAYPDFRMGPHAAARIRAWLGVPLLFGDRLIGMLTLDKQEPGFYSAAHARVALAFAAQAAIALENARLFTAAQQELAERKRAEEALRESEARYRVVSELTSDWAYALRVPADGRAVAEWVTGAFTRTTGYGLEEVEALGGFDSLVHPDDAPLVRERWERLKAGLSDVREYRLVTRGGEVRWLRVHGLPVRDSEQRRVTRVYGAAKDVTESKLKEQEEERLHGAVREAARDWQRTFDAVESPLLILDRRGIVRRLNLAAREALTKGLGSVVGWPIALVAGGPPWTRVVELARELGQRAVPSASAQVSDHVSSRTWDIDARLFSEEDETRSGGLLTAEAGFTPAEAAPLEAPKRGRGGDETRSAEEAAGARDERIIVVVREVTALVRLQESLRRSETLSAMGSLVAGVAHEVRNPLFAISASLDAFEARYGNRSESAQIIAVLREQVDRLVGLMHGLLEYGRPFQQALAEGSVHEVVEEAVQGCREIAGRRQVEVVPSVAGDASIRMDRRRLVQVFHNLLLNAIQHSPRGGRVNVSVQRLELGEQR